MLNNRYTISGPRLKWESGIGLARWKIFLNRIIKMKDWMWEGASE